MKFFFNDVDCAALPHVSSGCFDAILYKDYFMLRIFRDCWKAFNLGTTNISDSAMSVNVGAGMGWAMPYSKSPKPFFRLWCRRLFLPNQYDVCAYICVVTILILNRYFYPIERSAHPDCVEVLSLEIYIFSRA